MAAGLADNGARRTGWRVTAGTARRPRSGR